MNDAPVTLEERFAALVEALLGHPGVTHSPGEASGRKRFGASALKVHDKIFAMPVKGRLVVKLPRQRVDALIASGDGERFYSGNGRAMKEWLSLEPTSDVEWLPLAREAMEFVAAER